MSASKTPANRIEMALINAALQLAGELNDALERAEKAEGERDAMREDAERYRWLRPRVYGFDADFCENGLGVVFKFPENSRVGVGDSLDAAIDAERGKPA